MAQTAFVTDIGASEKFACTMTHFCPCLTATRAKAPQGYYVQAGAYAGCLSKRDKARLQGYPGPLYRPRRAGVSESQFGHEMGNCVSANVIMRFLPSVMQAAGLLPAEAKIRDFWKELTEALDKENLCVPV